MYQGTVCRAVWMLDTGIKRRRHIMQIYLWLKKTNNKLGGE